MKRTGHLMPQVTDFAHLYRSYKKALKGSGHTRESREFQFYLEPRLLELQRELTEGSYQPASYRYFRIFEPKERLIAVAPFRDRVVHHAIVGILEPIFEPTFIFDSYATRVGKGTHRAIKRAQAFFRQNRWVWKADIEKYFDSIHHDILLSLVARKIKDRELMNLIEKVIRNGGENGKGLPIGNLTSQFFANVYLNPFDHFVKEELKVKHYVRYMDDFVCFGHDKEKLKMTRGKLATFLREELHLDLKPSACYLTQQANGLSFLGARIFPELIRIKPENLRRIRKKIQRKEFAFEQGNLDEEAFLQAMNSYWSYLDHFDTKSLRQSWLEE